MTTLAREGRRALLAVFSLSTGIALLVSLQTLGLVLKDSLAVSGQMLIGADVAVSDRDNKLDTHAEQPLATWRANGDLVEYTSVSTRQVVAKKGEQTSLFELRVIEPFKYPLYGRVPIAQPPDASLAALLDEPDAIVISEQVSQRLQVALGDEIEVAAYRLQPFRIAGIVPARTTRPLYFDTAALLGVGYMSREAAVRILPAAERDRRSQFLIKTRDATQAQALAPQIKALSESYQVQVAETELSRTVQEIQGLNTLFLYVALLALLTSGIAIADTMLAMVTRRQDEIAILKTLGLDAFDLVILFTLEAALRGLTGSLVGIALGTGLGFGLQTFAEQFVGQPLVWRVHLDPILNALLVGPLAAIAFSLLPILHASGTRPIRLIRRQVDRRAGGAQLAVLAVILVTTAIMGGLAGVLTGDLLQGEKTAFGALLALLLLVMLFFILLWLAERLLQLAGRLWLDLELAVRGLARRRLRSAITLTTLTVGVFAIGIITVLASYARGAFVAQVDRDLGYNLVAFVPRPQANKQERAYLQAVPGLITLEPGNQATCDLVRVNYTSAKSLVEQRRAELEKQQTYGAWRYIQGRDLAAGLPDVTVAQGRLLTAEDAGARVLLVPDRLAAALGMELGDSLLLTIDGTPASFSIAGIYKRPNMSFGGAGFITSRETLENLSTQVRAVYRLRIEEQELAEATRFLSARLPGSLVVNTSDLLLGMLSLLDRLALLPVLIAGLTLFAGSVMIANSVSLVTLQRYEEIGILKALGATGARILSLIWLENNLIGLLGAAIGLALAVEGVILLGPEMFATEVTVVSLDKTGIAIPAAAALLVTTLATVLAVLPTLRLRPAAALRNE